MESKADAVMRIVLDLLQTPTTDLLAIVWKEPMPPPVEIARHQQYVRPGEIPDRLSLSEQAMSVTFTLMGGMSQDDDEQTVQRLEQLRRSVVLGAWPVPVLGDGKSYRTFPDDDTRVAAAWYVRFGPLWREEWEKGMAYPDWALPI